MSAAYAVARTEIARAVARAIAPRKLLRVSEWAAAKRRLSRKGSAIPGAWDNSRNPLQVEVMDCFSARSPVHEAVALFPIQFGKSEIETNILGYTMEENPQPIMVTLPGEVSMNKWIDQKLNPLIDETPSVQRVLTSIASRESSNRRSFKDFQGGQLYIEHAGNPVRLKSTAVGLLLVDEFSSFASALKSGDDPDAMLDGRTSAFPSTYKRFKVGTPEILGLCRLTALWAKSDQRHWLWPCPDCGHEQSFEWSGLHWTPDGKRCWYGCRECGVVIEEHQKTDLIARGRWVPTYPDRKIRGYHANCLYYPMGLGPRWVDLVGMWLDAQGDPAKLKTFINDRLAEAWEDPSLRKVKVNLIRDRRELYRLRTAPRGVLALTAGVDTQDDRLAVTILGWGRGMTCWVLDYVELAGDPGEDEVWAKLTDLLNRPLAHELGGWLRIEATAIDAGGHRTEHVKHFVRSRRVLRPMCIFGAVPNNAPVINRPKLEDVNYKGKLDKKGVHIYHVGTVGVKHWLFQRLSSDADAAPEARLIHLSEDLDDFYLDGLVSETFNPRKGRFEKNRSSVRNEPLDTFVYAYAAAHHHELRLHRLSLADWAAREARLMERAQQGASVLPEPPAIAGDSRETYIGLRGMPVRQAIDEILCQIDREPMSTIDGDRLDQWRRATGGLADEVAVLGALTDQLGEPGSPIVALLDAALVQRAREVLRGPSQPLTHRPARGTRHAGLK
ncbi:phage terminase large subunit family protein [Rhodanobacter sp. OR92]|uniref:phage terminase large subunit family protein n=1 Tax=Rhodanobacter sp. OR92 TaxID=1076524 RepID=UPI0004265B0F|nr:phage terminase large subunit family protein [Rhodanobacter sp. OR92]